MISLPPQSNTYQARETLRQYAEQKTADLFPDDGADVRLDNPSTYELLQRLEDSVLELKPANPRDQWWLDQAMTLAGKIGDTRWLLVQQLGQGTPKAFLALLIFWLTLLFAEGELAFVRSKLEQRALTAEVIEAKVAVAKALREVEVGWERAMAKIASRGGLENSPTGPVSAAA